MGRFSELQQELARSERHLAEGQARIARQAEFVRELYAEGHDTTFAAKRLFVLAANLNGMANHCEQIVRELSAAQNRAATGQRRQGQHGGDYSGRAVFDFHNPSVTTV
jgi:hypothetical protein